MIRNIVTVKEMTLVPNQTSNQTSLDQLFVQVQVQVYSHGWNQWKLVAAPVNLSTGPFLSTRPRLDQYFQMVGWCLVQHGKCCVYAKRMFPKNFWINGKKWARRRAYLVYKGKSKRKSWFQILEIIMNLHINLKNLKSWFSHENIDKMNFS